MLTIGVTSDTHVPDRVRRLDRRVISLFGSAGVEAILHAGDISMPGVLAQLAEVAPVYAVRGNRDWFGLRNLSLQRRLEFGGVQIGLAHGHGGWRSYLVDRLYFALNGYRHERLIPRLVASFPDVKVIVFGHGHIPLNHWSNGQLLFNPGSPHLPDRKDLTPSVGFLHISADREVRGEIVELR
jgi:putative phosphoesterase